MTEYTVSVVACIAGEGRCGSPIVRTFETLPFREYAFIHLYVWAEQTNVYIYIYSAFAN